MIYRPLTLKREEKKIGCLLYLCFLPSERIHKREIPWTVPVFLGSLTSLSVTFMLCLHQSAKYLLNSQLPSTEPETWGGEGVIQDESQLWCCV